MLVTCRVVPRARENSERSSRAIGLRALLAATIFALAGAWVPASSARRIRRASVARGVVCAPVEPCYQARRPSPKIKPVRPWTSRARRRSSSPAPPSSRAPRTDQFVFDVPLTERAWAGSSRSCPRLERGPARPKLARRARARARALLAVRARYVYISRPGQPFCPARAASCRTRRRAAAETRPRPARRCPRSSSTSAMTLERGSAALASARSRGRGDAWQLRRVGRDARGVVRRGGRRTRT